MATRTRPERAAVTKTLPKPVAPPTKRARGPSKKQPHTVNQNPYYLPTEAEIIDVKLIIQIEESALQNVEEALIRGQEAYNASITEAERLEAEEITAIRERFDTQIRQMTTSWEQNEAELKVQRKEIEEGIARRREFVAPVKRLPSDVLSYIFMIQVDCGGAPWTLLRVCRLWKVVTSSTPRIWRYIRIDGYDQRRFDSGTSFQNCFTNSQFEKALSRTGAAPLSICFDLPPRHLTDKAVDSKRFFGLFGTLIKVFNRCDAFELKGTNTSFSADEELFATLQFPVSSSLGCFRVGRGWEDSSITQKILVASNHESSALRELSMSTCDVSLADSLTRHQILLRRLTSFSADGFEVPRDVFTAMSCLSYFSQTGGSLALPQASGVFDLLQEAHFNGVNLQELGTHQFGNIRKLILRGCSIRPGAIKVPALDTLIFENRSWHPILELDCPTLSHLELGGGPCSKAEAKKEVNRLWAQGRGFVHLKCLKINLVMSDAVLIAVLKKLPALEVLSITLSETSKHGAAPGDTFFNSFLAKNTRRSEFLQNLHTLILQSRYGYSQPESLSALRTGIQRVVRSRQRSAPLRSAIIQIANYPSYGREHEWDVKSEEEFVVRQEEQ